MTPSQLAMLTLSPYPMRVFRRHLLCERHPDVVTPLHGETFAVRLEGVLAHGGVISAVLEEFAYAEQNASNPEIGHAMDRVVDGME
jgi:hypothetical protein